MIYVASSWRNDVQPHVVQALRRTGYAVYDFKNPRPGDHGFHWSDVDPLWKGWTPEQFIKGLASPIAEKGFKSDFDAMKESDTCVLVMPCGRSAHIEAGFFVQPGKKLFILLQGNAEPELMYKMANGIVPSIDELLVELEAQDVKKGSHA